MLMFKLSCFRWLAFSTCVSILVGLGLAASAQSTPRINAGNVQISGVPEDWSSHHVVFSDPGTEESAIKAGRYDKWLKTVTNPRYVMQQLKRNGAVRGPLAGDAAYVQHLKAEFAKAHPVRPNQPITPAPIQSIARAPLQPISRGPIQPIARAPIGLRKRLPQSVSSLKNDWAENLSMSSVMPNTFPAKYSFTPIGAPDCISDFVVYPTGATGSATAATIIAYNELYPGASPGCGTSDVPQVYWAYNTTIPDIAPGSVTTSPVLSLDGTMVAFVQSNGTLGGVPGSLTNLIILKTGPGGGGSMTAPVSITAASTDLSCTAPCMVVIPMDANSPFSDTFSSPYYDYGNDILYVGDDTGFLYQITPVFNNLAPNTTFNVAAAFSGNFHVMDSPVYDPVSGCVFVGDTAGYLDSFNSGVPGGSVCTDAFGIHARSKELATQSDGGFHDGVLLDPDAGEIYGFLSSGGNADLPQCDRAINCVVQFPTNFAGGVDGAGGADPSSAQPLGNETFGEFIYSGTLDNVYYNSTDTTATGNIWVVANENQYTSANLYQIPVSPTTGLGTPVATHVGFVGSVAGAPPFTPNFASPVTEFCNNGGSPCTASGGKTTAGTDTIYFSLNQGAGAGCNSTTAGAGCVVAYDVTTPSTPTLTGQINYQFAGPDTVTTSGIIGCWGTGGIIIDNDSTSTGASEVYYMYFGGNTPSPGDPNSVCGTGTGGTAEAIQAAQGTL